MLFSQRGYFWSIMVAVRKSGSPFCYVYVSHMVHSSFVKFRKSDVATKLWLCRKISSPFALWEKNWANFLEWIEISIDPNTWMGIRFIILHRWFLPLKASRDIIRLHGEEQLVDFWRRPPQHFHLLAHDLSNGFLLSPLMGLWHRISYNFSICWVVSTTVVERKVLLKIQASYMKKLTLLKFIAQLSQA